MTPQPVAANPAERPRGQDPRPPGTAGDWNTAAAIPGERQAVAGIQQKEGYPAHTGSIIRVGGWIEEHHEEHKEYRQGVQQLLNVILRMVRRQGWLDDEVEKE